MHDRGKGIRTQVSGQLPVWHLDLVVQAGVGVDGDVGAGGDVLGFVLDGDAVDQRHRLRRELNR